jgi:hypothetical protein
MFEKEAEELIEESKRLNTTPRETVYKAIEFGYNKANEWHYVNWKYFADKNYPKSESSSYLVQLKNKDLLICDWETEEGFGCFWDSNLYPIDNDDVYAWKEIVLPELKESE